MTSQSADSSRVRLAGPQDEGELLAVARSLHAENGIYSLSKDKVLAELRASLNQENGLIGVIGKNRIEGAAWLLFMQEWYTDDWAIFERFIHVLPDYRKSTNAADLIAWTRTIRAKCGVPMQIGVFSNQRTEAKMRFYRRQFGDPAGVFFVEGAQTGRAH